MQFVLILFYNNNAIASLPLLSFHFVCHGLIRQCDFFLIGYENWFHVSLLYIYLVHLIVIPFLRQDETLFKKKKKK